MKKLLLIISLVIGNIAFAADVKILHTSDIHGRISPIEYNTYREIGGLSRRVTFVDDVRTKNKNVLLLDSGDYFQGSLYYRMDKGKAIAKLMPYIKYDAVALGNHEFDNGTKILKRNIKLSKTQFLSANIHFKDRYLKKAVKPYIVKEFDGEKFLIIGVTTPKLKNLSNTKEVTVSDPVEEIEKIIKSVKYDKLVILSHCGLDIDREIANDIENIDLILGGHNHYFFATPDYENNTPIIQDGEFGVRVGIADFDKKLKKFDYQYITPDIKADVEVNKAISKIEKHNQKVKREVVATTKTTLIGEQNIIESRQTNLGRIVLISMAKPFGNNFDGVMTNSGSIRINRNLTGDITYADLLEILPFDNDIVMVEISGRDLKQVLSYGKAYGRRYLQYYMKENSIDDEKTYKIITNSYLAKGKDSFEGFKNARVIKHISTNPVKLLQQALKDQKTMSDAEKL